MDFTREPIIETVITPRDGYKIVVRSSKSLGQEEYFVEAVEVISFGGASFFRSQDRPKAFLVPVSDYEVLEVREARVVLKNVGLDRSIKIAGGREGQVKTSPKDERREERKDEESKEGQEPRVSEGVRQERTEGGKGRRDRRRGRGRRRGDLEEGHSLASEEAAIQASSREASDLTLQHEKIDLESPKVEGEAAQMEGEKLSKAILSGLLTPPPSLISETLHRYRDNALFQNAFYTKEELEGVPDTLPPEKPAELGSFEASVEREEQIWETHKKEEPAKEAAPNE